MALILLAGAAIGAVITATGFGIWYYLRHLAPKYRGSYRECAIPEGCLKIFGRFGQGNFGNVYKGEIKTSKGQTKLVAVKKLRDSDRKAVEKFYHEGLRMKPFAHKHVIPLYGMPADRNGSPLIVTPLMEHGDLHGFVGNAKWALTIGNVLQFSHQIACGMSYLHHNKIIHRDLAARNCMVNSDFNIKIGDFGLARKLEGEFLLALQSEPLPIAWLAVESLRSERKFYLASDVWSFGVTVWELFTRGETPYGSVAMHLIAGHVISGGRLQKPPPCPNVVYDMMMGCWNSNFKRRLSFADLKRELANMWHSCTNKNEVIWLSGHHNRGKKIRIGKAAVDDSGYVTRKPADFDILSEPMTLGRYDPTIYG